MNAEKLVHDVQVYSRFRTVCAYGSPIIILRLILLVVL